MHPLHHLDLHHDRARALQREAQRTRLPARAARQPSIEAHLSHWREVLGMRLVRLGLRMAGGVEMPLDRLRRLPLPRLTGEATPRESALTPPPPIT
jgi:hypothetical protein